MRYVRLGNTSLRVSDLALGTGALASRVDEKTSLKIMDCYIGEGGTFIDTANVYGRWNPGNLPLSADPTYHKSSRKSKKGVGSLR